jgi:hypothetical protein
LEWVLTSRYGIRAAYDQPTRLRLRKNGRFEKCLFQEYIESLNVFTKDLEYPVHFSELKVMDKDGNVGDVEALEEEMDDPLAGKWEFDWEDMENVLKDVMVS